MTIAGSRMSPERPVQSHACPQHLPVPLGCDYYRDQEGRLVQVLADDLLLDLRELLHEEPEPEDPIVATLARELRRGGDAP